MKHKGQSRNVRRRLNQRTQAVKEDEGMWPEKEKEKEKQWKSIEGQIKCIDRETNKNG